MLGAPALGEPTPPDGKPEDGEPPGAGMLVGLGRPPPPLDGNGNPLGMLGCRGSGKEPLAHPVNTATKMKADAERAIRGANLRVFKTEFIADHPLLKPRSG